MPYEQKDNSGSLFKNDRREKDTHANAKGSAVIEGVAYFVDAWTNTAQDGSKYQSLKFKRKDVQGTAPQAHRPSADLDDDIPGF